MRALLLKRRSVIFAVAFFFGLSIANAQIVPIREVFEPNPNHFPKASWAKVAVIQWAPKRDTPIHVDKAQAEQFKQYLRQDLSKYVREAALHGATLIVSPEFATVGYPSSNTMKLRSDEFRNRSEIEPYVEKSQGATFQYFSKLAKELSVYLHIGYAEVADDNQYYNGVLAIGPSGELIAKHRKINLFGGESAFLSAGKDLVTYESPFGRVALAICADIYDSRVMEGYKRRKVDVHSISASWTAFNSAMGSFINAAIWLKAFALGSNHFYFPDSGVVSPDGKTQSHIRQSMGVAYGYVRLKGHHSSR